MLFTALPWRCHSELCDLRFSCGIVYALELCATDEYSHFDDLTHEVVGASLHIKHKFIGRELRLRGKSVLLVTLNLRVEKHLVGGLPNALTVHKEIFLQRLANEAIPIYVHAGVASVWRWKGLRICFRRRAGRRYRSATRETHSHGCRNGKNYFLKHGVPPVMDVSSESSITLELSRAAKRRRLE